MSTSATAARAGTSAAKGAAPTITSSVRSALLQRQCACGAHAAGGECDDCKKKKGLISRKSTGPAAATPSGLVADALRSPGQPLDPDTRVFMESRFQRDFSAVRVHTDARAATSARALQARAWAWGSDLAFADGAYAPSTPAGRRLLAHELTHVVQQEQAAASVPSADADLDVSAPGDPAEREADRVADQVADSSPLVVRSPAAPDVIHRDWWDDLSGWEKAGVIGGGLGVAALIGLAIRSKLRKGPEDLDKEGECGSRQHEKIGPAMSTARQWSARALERLRAYKARPREPANRFVDLALNRRFRSAAAPVVEKVERVIGQVQAIVTASLPENWFCHTAKEPTCTIGSAYAIRGRNEIHFCTSFYKKDLGHGAVAVIHEVTHSLVGGAKIGDRAYETERMLGGGTEPNRLSSDENLTNAESYAEFVADLGTGTAFGNAPPADILECPDGWREPIKAALARVQRANANLSVDVAQKSGGAGMEFVRRWVAVNGPGNSPGVADATAALRAVLDRLWQPIRIVCRANPQDHCREGDFEWDDLATPPSLTLCSSWRARAEPERAVSLLAGLYGWIGKIDRAAWRTGLARVAMDTFTRPTYAPPEHADVFGSQAWTPDLLRVEYVALHPSTGTGPYVESGTVHERQSTDLPTYVQTDCRQPRLTLLFVPYYFVDTPEVPRPGPYSKPRLSVKYSHPSKQLEMVDRDPVPSDQPGDPISTFISKSPHKVIFDANGIFKIDVELRDPDSGRRRTYHDEIPVAPVLECPDAITSADARAGQAAPAPAAAPGQPNPGPAPINVQRAPDDTGRDIGIGLAIGGGVAAGGLIAAWAAGAFDSKKKPPEDKSKAGVAQTPPKPQTGGRPLPKISFDEAMEEGATRLKPAFGTACGLRKGQDPSDGYDAREWREDPSRGERGLIIVATTPSTWVAVDHLIANIGKPVPKAGGGETQWHFDCFEGVHVLRLYAYWRTLTQAEFDKRFPTLEIGFDSRFNLEWEQPIQSKGPGKAPYVEGPPKEIPGQMNFMPSEQPVGKSWAKLLDEAPKGSQVIWSNVDAAAKCRRDPNLDFCAFQNENATKIGPDRYWAHPFGIVSEQTVKDKMSEAVVGHVDKAYITKNIYISALRHPKERFEA
jgi:hypothetical protein